MSDPNTEPNSNDDLRKLCSSNPDIAYANDKVTLITYEERHVASYHEWMDDDETREMTCSERMTLDEEYKTRKQWAEHKYCGTFLIMDSKKFVESNGSELDSLIGDTNFVQYYDYVELLIMIGNRSCRQRGLATQAVSLMISHIGRFIGDRVIQASVCAKNTACIGLLQKLGFERQSQPASLDDVVFILPNDKRLLIEQSVSESIIYNNSSLIEKSTQRSKEYHMGLLQ